jgi:hypothetical protein
MRVILRDFPGYWRQLGPRESGRYWPLRALVSKIIFKAEVAIVPGGKKHLRASAGHALIGATKLSRV